MLSLCLIFITIGCVDVMLLEFFWMRYITLSIKKFEEMYNIIWRIKYNFELESSIKELLKRWSVNDMWWGVKD